MNNMNDDVETFDPFAVPKDSKILTAAEHALADVKAGIYRIERIPLHVKTTGRRKEKLSHKQLSKISKKRNRNRY